MKEEQRKEFEKILFEEDFIEYESEKDQDAVLEIIEKLRAWGCKWGGHQWTYDQCGYWQHQYCIGCGVGKYPDLARQKCSELNVKMGGMTEDEFLATPEAPPQ